MTSRSVLTEDGAKHVFKTLSTCFLNPASQTQLKLSLFESRTQVAFICVAFHVLFKGDLFSFVLQAVQKHTELDQGSGF